MIRHVDITSEDVRRLIRHREIVAGGNFKLKIYGRLNCRSGKRMKKRNRVFFSSAQEAIDNGFRPCGHCMADAYKKWKNQF